MVPLRGTQPKVGRWLIYGIIDPDSGTLIYIGKTHKRREPRLREHVESSLAGSSAPIHVRIRQLISLGRAPEVFVLKCVEPNGSWPEQERQEIAFWRSMSPEDLPITIRPQTLRSHPVIVRSVEILNVKAGG